MARYIKVGKRIGNYITIIKYNSETNLTTELSYIYKMINDLYFSFY